MKAIDRENALPVSKMGKKKRKIKFQGVRKDWEVGAGDEALYTQPVRLVREAPSPPTCGGTTRQKTTK